MRELTITVTGEAGLGMQTVGTALCALCRDNGYQIFASQDYMSRIRGGNNSFQVRVSGVPVHCPRASSDIIVALDRDSVALHRGDVLPGGVMLVDREKFGIAGEETFLRDIPLFRMAADAGGEGFVSAVAIGAVAGLLGMGISGVERALARIVGGKGREIAGKNTLAVRAGYDFAREHLRGSAFALEKSDVSPGPVLMNGNDAIALAAIRAGCKFYSAYPMTPSTSIMNVLAHLAGTFNILVEQAEDEIAAINMAIGASFAGARAMTATSGGGFALMTEGVSLAAMTETPLVVVVAQRPAPATGFPTRTEQADLEFVLHAGHGEFARAVYAPGTIEEAFYLTAEAFNTAERYQIPVFIMTDQLLADSYRNIPPFDMSRAVVRRAIITKEESSGVTGYKRYRFTDSGISPRAIPSWIGDVIYTDSDEHTEEGHITEDAATRTKMVHKRFYQKMKGLSSAIIRPTAHNLDGARVVLLGFGSTRGVMREVSERMAEKRVGVVHLSQVWPFPAAELAGLIGKASRVISVENNAGAQLARLVRRECGFQVHGSILKFDGRPFTLDYLMERVSDEC